MCAGIHIFFDNYHSLLLNIRTKHKTSNYRPGMFNGTLIETGWDRGSIETDSLLLQLNSLGRRLMHTIHACWINSGHSSSGGAAAQNHHSVLVTALIRQRIAGATQSQDSSTQMIIQWLKLLLHNDLLSSIGQAIGFLLENFKIKLVFTGSFIFVVRFTHRYFYFSASGWFSPQFHSHQHQQGVIQENDILAKNRWRFSSALVGVSIRLDAGFLFHCFLVDHLVLCLHIPQQR